MMLSWRYILLAVALLSALSLQDAARQHVAAQTAAALARSR